MIKRLVTKVKVLINIWTKGMHYAINLFFAYFKELLHVDIFHLVWTFVILFEILNTTFRKTIFFEQKNPKRLCCNVNIISFTKLTSYFTLLLSTICLIKIVEWHSKLSKTVLHNIVKNFWHLCSGCDMGCRTVGLKYTISGPDIK